MIEPNARFIALHCGDETKELMARHPNAFLLLTQIAMRARFKDCPITGLRTGQAFIGDFREAGIQTQMAYRHAKQILTDCGLATFQGTNKGTVATLENSMIFSLSSDQRNEPRNNPATNKERTSNEQATNKERSNNDQGTTNHNGTRTQGYKDTMTQGELIPEKKTRARFVRPTLLEVSAYVSEMGYTMDPEAFFDHYETKGWKVGKEPMQNWKSAVRSWNRRQSEFAASKPSPTPSAPKTTAVPFVHFRGESHLKVIPGKEYVDPDIDDPIPF